MSGGESGSPNGGESTRCFWVPREKPYYVAYHDEEWGVPVHEDRLHFEMLILEGAQAGLSWDTVLRKRESYRAAFTGFDAKKVARFSEDKLEKLLLDPGIVRNRLKVYGAVKCAKAFLEVQKEFGTFDAYVWRFVGGRPLDGKRQGRGDVPAKTAESDALSKDLVKRGFTFVGSTIVYAYMQAVGLVNDHTVDCWRYREVGGGR
ncbi:MAG: DNA-3-methyladenine glycosylase I [Acidobacteria bacterium]|nr:DNA-3-methyladenine glycosylase I [Acidobacteriota bacterium]